MSKTVVQFIDEAGVHDLPRKARHYFARALAAEQRGDHLDAELLLKAAIAADTTRKEQ